MIKLKPIKNVFSTLTVTVSINLTVELFKFSFYAETEFLRFMQNFYVQKWNEVMIKIKF